MRVNCDRSFAQARKVEAFCSSRDRDNGIVKEVQYPKAVECLSKDREALSAFYGFPAEQWVHIRTTNPIESTFATVRLRTGKTRGCVSQDSILSLVFKLVQSAQKRWLWVRGFKRLAEVIEGVKLKDGIRTDQNDDLATQQDAA